MKLKRKCFEWRPAVLLLVLMLLGSSFTFAQRRVSGTVLDQKGEAVIGANVVVKGTTVGTITDIDGKFSIEAGNNAVLRVTYVGFLPQDVQTGNRTTVNVTLNEDSQNLDEVVVVGYGTMKKKDLTGAVGVVQMESIDKQPVIRIEDALKGKSAGVQITTANKAPGASMKIRIRGVNSVNGNNDPLYVVDGFVGADFSSLNPNDIESINILKDASATSVYGSRGSNGVVLITTKQAKAGQATKIDYDGFVSFDWASKRYDLVNGQEYMKLGNERQAASNFNPWFSETDIKNAKTTDWQSEILRTGITQNHQVAISGAANDVRYYLSGSYADQEGVIKNSYYKRYGIRSNLNTTIAKRLDVAFNFYGTFTQSRNNYAYDGRNSAMGGALVAPPVLPVIDPATGTYTVFKGSWHPIATNPVFSATERNFENTSLRGLGNLNLTWRIWDNLKLSVNGGIDISSYWNPTWKLYLPGNTPSSSEAQQDAGFFYTFQNTNTLSYDKTFAKHHKIDAAIVYEQQHYTARGLGAWVTDFPTISLGYYGLGLGATKTVSSSYSMWGLQSFLGRVNYSFMDKYLLTVAFRADGSSKFAEGNKYGYFPSGALAWRASEESFIKQLNFFDNLKLRGSYGVVGSQAIAPYATMAALQYGWTNRDYWFNQKQTSGIGSGNAVNKDLKWESTAQTNVGLDFGIFKNRLSGSIDWYYKKTTDLLFGVSVPAYNGGGTVTKNIGSMSNTGWEFMLTGVIVDNKDWNVTSSINYSMNKNKILDMGNEKQIFYGNSVLNVGESMAQFWGYEYLGVWKSSEKELADKYVAVPGDAKFLDWNGPDGVPDGKIDSKDMKVLGCALPTGTFGWNTTVTYKDFDLNVFFNGQHGNKMWNMTPYLLTSGDTDCLIPTLKEFYDNHWVAGTNENAKYPFPSSTMRRFSNSSQFLEDGSFLRLANITLGWRFDKYLKKLAVKQAKIYVSANNLFLLTSYSGYDPETSTAVSSDKEGGIDRMGYPGARSFIVGLKIGF